MIRDRSALLRLIADPEINFGEMFVSGRIEVCLLYTSDAADERSSVDLGGRRIIKKKKRILHRWQLEVDYVDEH